MPTAAENFEHRPIIIYDLQGCSKPEHAKEIATYLEKERRLMSDCYVRQELPRKIDLFCLVMQQKECRNITQRRQ